MNKINKKINTDHILKELWRFQITLSGCLKSLDFNDQAVLLEYIQKELNNKTSLLRQQYLQIEDLPF